jgi:hypothetical protein
MSAPAPYDQLEILDELLRSLVKIWGQAIVSKHLLGVDATNSGNRKVERGSRGSRGDRLRRSALAYASRADLPTQKKALILQLAQRFDDKKFLYSVGDIRNFFQINSTIDDVRSRDTAIPKLIQVLSIMSEDKLKKVLSDETYSGPSQLGPLADAIRAVGASLGRRSRFS